MYEDGTHAGQIRVSGVAKGGCPLTDYDLKFEVKQEDGTYIPLRGVTWMDIKLRPNDIVTAKLEIELGAISLEGISPKAAISAETLEGLLNERQRANAEFEARQLKWDQERRDRASLAMKVETTQGTTADLPSDGIRVLPADDPRPLLSLSDEEWAARFPHAVRTAPKTAPCGCPQYRLHDRGEWTTQHVFDCKEGRILL